MLLVLPKPSLHFVLSRSLSFSLSFSLILSCFLSFSFSGFLVGFGGALKSSQWGTASPIGRAIGAAPQQTGRWRFQKVDENSPVACVISFGPSPRPLAYNFTRVFLPASGLFFGFFIFVLLVAGIVFPLFFPARSGFQPNSLIKGLAARFLNWLLIPFAHSIEKARIIQPNRPIQIQNQTKFLPLLGYCP